MNRFLYSRVFTVCLLLALAPRAVSFCGFYVAKADTKLFNKASQVVLVRHQDRTALTMASDYQGDPKEFAVVIPVPTLIQRDEIKVVDKAVIDHLDAYSAPRLVEYFDEDPCAPKIAYKRFALAAADSSSRSERDKALGVKVEARYTVGEYDIVILSADQSDGLTTWLVENGYRIPPGAEQVLGGYIKQKMRFFVAKVNLAERERLGFAYLRPIQVSYQSAKFMLPIRLGMVNANGPQELFIYALSAKGRIETINYRTVKLPTGMDLPVYVKEVFGDFYRAMFSHQVLKEEMRVVFQEYAWDMGWCDPCAADPLSDQELHTLGVSWSSKTDGDNVAPQRGSKNVYVTRLHLRYDATGFPEDLVFQETGDRTNFQGRYVLRHPWKGEPKCPAAEKYREQLRDRHETEAKTLADLTGWPLREIRAKMGLVRDF